MKVAIIVPYFGKLPSYYQLFLDSCSYNPTFDWIIISDDNTEFRYPSNVHLIDFTFDACQKLIQSCFDFQITLNKPQKLCDFKCAYGLIFQKYLNGYDWWGHCDLDQIFGNLSTFITIEMLNTYDKIGSIGHLTLYRNTPENNRVFMNTSRYREVFSTEFGCGFDEWLPGNVNEIYMNSIHPIYMQNPGADVNSYRTTFQTVEYDVKAQCYIKSSVRNSIFYWKHGTLIKVYINNRQLHYSEYPYIHLQKRAMKDCRKNRTASGFYVVPNRFVDDDSDPTYLLKLSAWYNLFNFQFFKVKYKSLQYRINSGNWKFSNVFNML